MRSWLYAFLVLIGTALPLTQLVPWVLEHGLDIRLFVEQLFANRISSFFAVDLLIFAVIVIVMCFQERKRSRWWWLPVLLTLSVGVSSGLPMLLLLREIEGAEEAF